jgi:hypothetical protein
MISGSPEIFSLLKRNVGVWWFSVHFASDSIVAESMAGLPASLSAMLPEGMSTRLAAPPRNESIERLKRQLLLKYK